MAKRNLPEIKRLVAKYAEELKKQNVHVERVILYGSYAKGVAEAYSDIDLVVISSDLKRWPFLERLQMLSRATLTLHAPFEVLGYTPQEIQEHGPDSILWEEITKTGKEIYKKAA